MANIFVEVQFSTHISHGSSGGPEFSTNVVTLGSGHEQRNSNWDMYRARYNIAWGIHENKYLDELLSFFIARKGKAEGFRYKDWADYLACSQILGVGDGSTVVYQLIKKYISGGVEYIRKITKPVENTVSVYLNDVEQFSGWTIDTTTGSVTFSTPPPIDVIVTSSFEFDVPVRFDTDRLSVNIEDYGIHSAMDIPLIEIKI